MLSAAALSVTVVATPLNARLPFMSRPLESRHGSALGDWRLRIERNRFSGEIQCRLRFHDKSIVYASHALGFRFSKHLNTSRATYRIDGEPVKRWRDDLPELVDLGAPIDGPRLDNPTGGTVWIPVAKLQDANRVTIQPRPNRHPVVFRLRGFSGLLAIAQAQGCTPDSRFVP